MKNTVTEHSDIGPSALHRLLNCAASYQASQGTPRSVSPYAAAGTLVHEMCERAIWGENEDAMLGETHNIDGYDFTVNADMVMGTKMYLSICRPLMRWADVYGVEDKVDIGPAFGDEGPPVPMFGTADFWAYNKSENLLKSVDMKYGTGPVSPKDNPQVMAYALGVVLQMGTWPRGVEITIVQPRDPRGKTIKTWTITGLDLMIWMDQEMVPGIHALFEDDPAYNPGSWCFFCPAKLDCKGLRDQAVLAAQCEFEKVA